MQKIMITLILFISSSFLTVAQEQTHNLTVEIAGMENDNGRVYIALYNSENSFLKNGFRGDIIKIDNKKSTVVFKNIPEGDYAISVFHDENNNQKMDTIIFGIPKESYGFSNNATGFMGPAKYEDAKFSVSKDSIISIKID